MSGNNEHSERLNIFSPPETPNSKATAETAVPTIRYFAPLNLWDTTIWPRSAGPQSEMPNSKYDESSSTSLAYVKSPRNARAKTPYSSRIPNKNATSKTMTENPFRIDAKDVYVIDSITAENSAVPPIRYFASLWETWPTSDDKSSSTSSRFVKSARNARVKTPNLLGIPNNNATRETRKPFRIDGKDEPQQRFLKTGRSYVPSTDPMASTSLLRTPIAVDRVDGVGLVQSQNNLPIVGLCSSSQSLTGQKLPNDEISASGNFISSQETRDELVSEKQNHISCPVCLESSIGRQPYVTKCGHIFCGSCIKESIGIAKKCPMCQKILSLEMIFPVYM